MENMDSPRERLKKYSVEICEDLKVNDMNLSEKAFNVPHKKHYWASRYILEFQKLNDLEREKKELEKESFNRMREKAAVDNPVAMSDASIKKMINGTKTLQDITQQIDDQKVLVMYLEKCEKIFSFITNDIKNIIEVKQMESM